MSEQILHALFDSVSRRSLDNAVCMRSYKVYPRLASAGMTERPNYLQAY